MKPSAARKASVSVSPGITAKKAIWSAAAPMKTRRGPKRSRRPPTTTCASEATAKTRKARPPMAVAVSASPGARLSARSARLPARPVSRSAKIFGSAKVVDWKMIEETAVVRNTMAETRRISARRAASTSPLARGAGRGAVRSSRMPSRRSAA